MGVFTQPRVVSEVHRQREVPHRPHPECLPQVHRNGNFDRFCPFSDPSFFHLQFAHGAGQHCRQVSRHRHAGLMGLFQQFAGRQHPGHNMAESIRFRRSAQMVRRVLRPADGPRRPAAEEAVPRFLPHRLFLRVNQPSLPGNPLSVLQLQIHRRQVLQQRHAAGPVRHGMEKLRRNPVPVVQEADAAGMQFFFGHMCQGIGVVLPGFRRLPDRLQVIPEKTGSQPYKTGGKPRLQLRDRAVQDLRIHFFPECHRYPENIVPVLPDDGRENQRSVVQPVPLFLHLILPRRFYHRNLSSVKRSPHPC